MQESSQSKSSEQQKVSSTTPVRTADLSNTSCSRSSLGPLTPRAPPATPLSPHRGPRVEWLHDSAESKHAGSVHDGSTMHRKEGVSRTRANSRHSIDAIGTQKPSSCGSKTSLDATSDEKTASGSSSRKSHLRMQSRKPQRRASLGSRPLDVRVGSTDRIASKDQDGTPEPSALPTPVSSRVSVPQSPHSIMAPTGEFPATQASRPSGKPPPVARRQSIAEALSAELLTKVASKRVSLEPNFREPVSLGIGNERKRSQRLVLPVRRLSDPGEMYSSRLTAPELSSSDQGCQGHTLGTRGVASSPSEERPPEHRCLDAVRHSLGRVSPARTAGTCVCLLTIFAAIAVFIIYYFLTSSEKHICSTDDCIEHASEILRRLDTSADPCTNFHVYVCGSNDRQRDKLTVGEAQHYARQALQAAIDAATSAHNSSSAASNAAVALLTCLKRTPAGQSADLFGTFLSGAGVSWPVAKASTQLKTVDVLDVLLNLTVNWRALLWFDVKISYLDHEISPIVMFGEPGPLPFLRMQELSALGCDAYSSLVEAVAKSLTEYKDGLRTETIQELSKDETAIRKILLLPTDQHDALVSLHELESHLTNVDANSWIMLLSKYFRWTYGWSSDTKVLVVNEHIFTQLLIQISAIPAARLINVVGWMFSYVYIWTVNSSFDLIHPGSPAESTIATLCFLAIHESFGVVPAGHQLSDPFIVGAISNVLKRTTQAISTQINASGFISDSTKQMAHRKILSHLQNPPWPAEAFIRADQRDLLYVNFPRKPTQSFFEFWLRSKEALKATLSSPYYNGLMTARYRWHASRAIYFYTLNRIRLGFSALLPPSFLSRGSDLMTFSGLGFWLARELVRAVDERGRQSPYRERGASWWEQEKPCALDAAHSTTEKAMIGDLFALDVSLSALKSSSDQALSSLRLQLLEGFSPTQTFYMSYCSHFCDEPQGPAMCNAAVNASDFAEAFNCPPQNKRPCLFF